MPEIAHDELSHEIRDAISAFCAVEHREDSHIPLHGPVVLYSYSAPERRIEQGVVCVFRSGEVPMIVMVAEKTGERIRIQVSRMTESRVELFRGDNMFSDLENNYVDQML